jgi:hypothetical protein
MTQPDQDPVVVARKRIQRILIHSCLSWGRGTLNAWEKEGMMHYDSLFSHEQEVLNYLCEIGLMGRSDFQLLMPIEELDQHLDAAIAKGHSFGRVMAVLVGFMPTAGFLPSSKEPFTIPWSEYDFLENWRAETTRATRFSEAIHAELGDLLLDLTSLGFMEKRCADSFAWTDEIAIRMRANGYSW